MVWQGGQGGGRLLAAIVAVLTPLAITAGAELLADEGRGNGSVAGLRA